MRTGETKSNVKIESGRQRSCPHLLLLIVEEMASASLINQKTVHGSFGGGAFCVTSL